MHRISLQKLLAPFLFSFISLFGCSFLCFFFALLKKRSDLADIFWGIGFLVVAWVSFVLGEFSYNGLIINVLVTLWAVRLSIHIYLRNTGSREDFRYEKWKTKREIFFQVFLLQGIILFIVALPIIWIQTHPIDKIPLFPIIIWSLGFLLEAITDYQLRLFKKDKTNKGKLLMTGLWGYVRHPNYLGEMIQWWSIWVITLYLPYGFLFIISPLLITVLIIWVSGIKPIENRMNGHPDFVKYAKTTPSLMPLSVVNALLYGVSWFFIVAYGRNGSIVIPLMIAITVYLSQLALFSKYDRKKLLVYIVLSICAFLLGSIQESFFIYTDLIIYPNQSHLAPLWVLVLYPVFSFTLNSSLSFLNNKPFITFILGGVGANLSYLAGEKLGAVILSSIASYVVIFICWGLFLNLLLYINRKLMKLLKSFQ